MTSKKSCAKGTLKMFLWTLKKHYPIALIATALMAIVLPVYFYMTILKYDQLYQLQFKKYGSTVGSSFYNSQVFGSFIMGLIAVCVISIVMIVIYSTIIYGYMHSKKSVDVFHSLPVTRTQLFLGKYFGGLFFVLVPTALIFAVTYLIYRFFPNALNYLDMTMHRVGLGFVFFLLLEIAAYTFCVFFAVNAGTKFDTISTMLIISLGFPLLTILFNNFSFTNLFGYSYPTHISDYFSVSPILQATMIMTDSRWPMHVYWAVFTLVFFFLSLFLYKKRKSEVAGRQYAYPYLKYITKAILSIVAGMILGEIFTPVGQSATMYIFGFIVGSAIAYSIAEIILSRGFKKLLKSYIAYAIITAIFFCAFTIVKFDLFRYGEYIPDRNEIVSIGCEQVVSSSFNLNTTNNLDIILKEKTSIDTVYSVLSDTIQSNYNPSRKTIISEDQPGYSTMYSNVKNMRITYYLKNGQKIDRHYSVRNTEQITSLSEYQKLYGINYMIRNNYTPTNENNSCIVTDIYGVEHDSYNLTGKQIAEIKNAYAKDVNSEIAVNIEKRSPAIAVFVIPNYNNNNYLLIKENYRNLKQTLEKNKISYRSPPNKITSVYVGKNADLIGQNGVQLYPNYYYSSPFYSSSQYAPIYDFLSNEPCANITDKEKINQLISAVREHDGISKSGYILEAVFDDGRISYSLYIPESLAPAFLKTESYALRY